jgi:predicted HTH domain antitoxin
MKTVAIKLPDFVDIDIRDIKFIIASKLYEQGKLSLGESAELAGTSKRTFMELLGDYGVSVFNYTPDELEDDLKNA